jgi:hypothetical protein
MSSRVIRTVAALLVVASAACASGGKPAAGVTIPPKLIQTADFPQLASRDNLRDSQVNITVMVDPDGRADISTLQVTGTATTEARVAVSDWIARSRFHPAQREGKPVRAEFTTTIKSKVTRERRP